ncbi:MAG: TlpA family protein disulfide reductase [Candidatus Eisenbacteria bacterium]|uniref:TlpA family protein disulfide reductase n=1 Tax=Eiseniibacteriota bacterium TaxID=2212470 RepID=A0A956N937_UNCEI|nr:TlpA family protein disulfide reductase [Candidatus Eisenbacteria bacterium]MCB9465068.1 TlpA family protein disulfide reductase [Candidatus Eisenbacteria bacterium]
MTHLRLALVVLSSLVLMLVVYAPAQALQVGDPFPSMTLTDLDGDRYDLSNISGRVVVIYFLGSSCSSCANLADQIEGDFVTAYRGERVSVFAVDSWDGLPEELARVRDEAGVRFPFLLNGSGLVSTCDMEWHSFVILDTNGTVQYVNEIASGGSYNPSAMQSVVDEFLPEPVDTEIVTWGEIKRFYERNRRAGRPVFLLP